MAEIPATRKKMIVEIAAAASAVGADGLAGDAAYLAARAHVNLADIGRALAALDTLEQEPRLQSAQLEIRRYWRIEVRCDVKRCFQFTHP